MSRIRLIVNAVPMTYTNTGIGRYLRELYMALENSFGDQLDIRYFDGKSTSKRMPPPPADKEGWARLTKWFWKLPPHIALGIRILRHTLMELRFYRAARDADIYHEASFFPFRTPSGVKTVFTVHDMSLERHPEYHPKERVLFHNLFFRSALKRAQAFIAVSEFTKKEFTSLTGVAPERVTVTHLAHNPDIFYPRPADEVREAVHRFTLPDKYFLFVGGGDPRKKLETVPPALALADPEAKLAVVGWAGWATAQELNNTVGLGHITDNDLARLYSGAQALVFPSEYEGFGLPILEAMACGCPVVTSRKASLPEVAGNAGMYVDNPMETLSFADRLGTVIERANRRQHTAAGIERSIRFSWDATAKKTMECLRKTT